MTNVFINDLPDYANDYYWDLYNRIKNNVLEGTQIGDSVEMLVNVLMHIVCNLLAAAAPKDQALHLADGICATFKQNMVCRLKDM